MIRLVEIELEARAERAASDTGLPPTYLVGAKLHQPEHDLWHAEVGDFKGNWYQPVQYGMVQKLPESMNAHTAGKRCASRLVFTLRTDRDDDLESLIQAFRSQVGRRKLEGSPSIRVVFEQEGQKIYLGTRLSRMPEWSWAGCGRTPQAVYQHVASLLDARQCCVRAVPYSFSPGRIDTVDFTLANGSLVAGLTEVAETIFPFAPRW